MSVNILLATVVVALLAAVVWGLLTKRRAAKAKAARAALDTIAAWPPQAARVMNSAERTAFKLLDDSLPRHSVLAQVPLARFLTVPRRHSYTEWLRRVGHYSVDLLVCNASSQPIAMVAIGRAKEDERTRNRRARMVKVLEAAGVRCTVWQEGVFPAPQAVRNWIEQVDPTPMAPAESATDLPSRPLGAVSQPPPSTWFDEWGESTPMPLQDERAAKRR